uniref:C2H2-type domain-containing protein n=1 Tax=Angiostrongylus cantonensis TaxID=6313 RepID=A0A0K0DKH7_ANGCA
MSLTRKERVDIAVLAGNRRSQREIADEFNKLHPGRKPISPTTVGSILAEFEETDAIFNKSRRLPGKARNSEQQAVSDFVDSKSFVDDVMRTQVGNRHVPSEIDEYLEEGLLDMPEEPEEASFFKELYATDLLGTAGADDEEDQPTDSFVTADVDDEEDQPPDSFVTSNERNLLREYFEKNFRCVPFNWTAPSSLVTYSKPEIPANQAEQSKEDYATCKLCGKTIQTSRFTNLSNHARRHAEAKKYRCAHCTFQHYEPFKVSASLNVKSVNFTVESTRTFCSQFKRILETGT